MKTTQMFIAIILVGIISNSSKIYGQENADQKSAPGARYRQCSVTAHRAWYDDIKIYLGKFLNKKDLEMQARNLAISGFIPKAAIVPILKTEYKAYRFYPCYEKDASNNELVYVAIYPDRTFNPANPTFCDFTVAATLNISSTSYKYNQPGISPVDINQFVSMDKPMPSMVVNTRTTNQVSIAANAFIDQYKDGGVRLNNDFCCAFLYDELECLLNHPCEEDYTIIGIRYYFGYDEKCPNKIRIVLTPVIAHDGKSADLLDCADFSDPLMMEHAWPPNCHISKKN